jgi:hypothetical protein
MVFVKYFSYFVLEYFSGKYWIKSNHILVKNTQSPKIGTFLSIPIIL